MTVPDRARFVVIGAGVHGLSTAWHLAKELEARGLPLVLRDDRCVTHGLHLTCNS